MKVFAIKCKKCNEIVYSRAVHDFAPCSCGACFVDGGQGNEYVRIGGNPEDFERLSGYEIKAKDKNELIEDYRSGKDKYGREKVNEKE